MSNLSVYAKNLRKLAAVLTSIPDNQHNQDDWVTAPKAACGTVGCAAGWAAMSGQFPGLAYGVRKYDYDIGAYKWATTMAEATRMLASGAMVNPIVNGKLTNWGKAAPLYFGNTAMNEIFLEDGSRKEVIAKLLKLAKRFETRVKLRQATAA